MSDDRQHQATTTSTAAASTATYPPGLASAGPAETTTTNAARGGERGRARDPFFDNARLIAIILVVVGHSWEPLRGSHGVKAAYALVYSFHMPVFILVSGYLSRSFAARPRQVRRLVSTIVAPYLIMQVATELFRYLVLGKSLSLDLLSPTFALWFLAALFIWRLTTPIWNSLRYPVPVAVAVSLVSGLGVLPGQLSLSRTLALLPFYVLGLTLRPWHFDFVRTRWARIAAVPVLLIGLAGAYLAVPRYSLEWVFWRQSYHQIGVSNAHGLVARAAMLLVGLVMLCAFLALVPRKRFWFTTLGAGTLYVYLLHRFVIKGVEGTSLYSTAWLHHPMGIITVTVLAAALAVLLATPPVRRVFRPVVEPRLDWLMHRPEPSG